MKQFFIFFILLTLSLTIVSAQKGRKEMPKEKEHSLVRVGILQKTYPLALKKPSEYCLEDGYLYKSTSYKIGDMNIHFEKKEDVSALVGKVVLVYGKKDKDLNQIIVKQGKAPSDYGREASMMQIRSDWVGEETGFDIGHSSREKLKKVTFLRCSKIQEFKGLNVKRHEKEGLVEVSFQNTLGEDVNNLEIIAHYESVKGKPSPHYKKETFSTVKPWQSATVTFPTMVKEHKRYSIRSVLVEAYEKEWVIEIEESL